jgi:hypothetical protein
MRTLLLVPVLLPLVAPSASAQWLPAPFATLKDRTPQAHQAPYTAHRPGHRAGAIVGGILGATAGLLGGAMLGSGMKCPSVCENAGAISSGLIGEGAGLALGAHLGNGSRGNLAQDLLASAGGAVVGIALASGANDAVLLIPAMAFQVGLVAGIELKSARLKAEKR